MIDRIEESKKFLEILNECVARKTILIIGEPGSGTSYFVNHHCNVKEQLKLERKNIWNSFEFVIISLILDKCRDKFLRFIKNYKQNYNLVYPCINFYQPDHELINVLKAHYKDNTTFEYEHKQEECHSFAKKEKFTIKILKRNFKNLIAEFIDGIKHIKYVVYENWDSTDDIVNIKDLISRLNCKTNILVLKSSELFKQYVPNYIRIVNFNDDEAIYYAELLSSRIILESKKKLNDLARELQLVLHGSPKELILLLEKCEKSIKECKTDEEIISIIRQQKNYQFDLLKDIVLQFILLVLYFSRSEMKLEVLTDILCRLNYAQKKDIMDKINILYKNDFVDVNYMNIVCTNKARTYLHWNILKTKKDQYMSALTVISFINTCYSKKELSNNADVIKLIVDILCNVKNFGYAVDIKSYQDILQQYMKFIFNMDIREDIEFFSLFGNFLKYENYQDAFNIAELLYNNGYYSTSLDILQCQDIKSLNSEQQFDYYLLLANCDMLIDNSNAIKYFSNAINLKTSKRLIAIGCKLLAEIEANKTKNFKIIQKEYNHNVEKYKDKPDTPGYIALLRNALDFYDNNDAIHILEQALNYAKEYKVYNEIYKIKQNLALNLIRAGQYDVAESYLLEVLKYCKENSTKEISYPLINLAVINIYRFFESEEHKYDYAIKAIDYAMKAMDSATSYYALTLSHIHFLTSLSILYGEINNRYCISINHIKSLRNSIHKKIINNQRNDFRAIVKPYLALIASARITNDIDEAIKYVRELCLYKSEIGKEAKKVNQLLDIFGIKDIDKMPEPYLDNSCKKHQSEIRFEPWLISLTHY